MNHRILGIGLVCLLLTGAVALQASEGKGPLKGDTVLDTAERAYAAVERMLAVTADAPPAAVDYLSEARTLLDLASNAPEAPESRDMALEAMAAIREAARLLDMPPEPVVRALEARYARLTIALLRTEGAVGRLHALGIATPVVDTALEAARESLENAARALADGALLRAQAALEEASIRIRHVEGALRDALGGLRLEGQVTRFFDTLGERLRAASAIIAAAEASGADTTEAMAAFDDIRHGLEEARTLRQEGYDQESRELLASLAPLLAELREALRSLSSP